MTAADVPQSKLSAIRGVWSTGPRVADFKRLRNRARDKDRVLDLADGSTRDSKRVPNPG